MTTTKRQAVVRISGDYDLVKELLHIVEQRTQGIASKIMKSRELEDYHAFVTVFEVVE